MKSRMLLLTICLICLCGCCEYDIFLHPETKKYQAQFGEDVPKNIFKKKPEFVDNGVFFIPEVRELAWAPPYRSFISFYSRTKTSIHVIRVQATSASCRRPAIIEANQTVSIAKVDPKTGLFSGYIPTLYHKVDFADEVFSADAVTITIEYRFKGDTKDRKMTFKVIRETVKDIAWST